jgi:phosphoribosyl 1,2-cyclic phosphodiesterase
LERVRSSNILVLESNHCVKLLQDDTRRPWSLKQRILSRHGHLSNDAAAAVAEELAAEHLRRIYLGHLSRDCNRPEIARRVVGERLASIGAHHIVLEDTSQETRCATVRLEAGIPHVA